MYFIRNVICTISVLRIEKKTEKDDNQHLLRKEFMHFDYEKVKYRFYAKKLLKVINNFMIILH